VEVLPRGTGGIDQAGIIGQVVSLDADRTSPGDFIETGTGQSLGGSGDGAALEVLVEIAEGRVVGTGIGISLEGEPCVVNISNR
jgi:hypothetical protein